MINLAFKLKPEGCSISYFKKYTMEDSCPLYTAAACLTRLCSVGRSCDAVAFHLAFIEFLICAATHKFWLVCVLSSYALFAVHAMLGPLLAQGSRGRERGDAILAGPPWTDQLRRLTTHVQ